MQEALKDYGLAAQLDPTNALYIYNYANTLFELKEFAKALAKTEMLCQLTPKDADVYNLRGRIQDSHATRYWRSRSSRRRSS